MSTSPRDRSAEDFVNQHLHAVWRYLRMHGAAAQEADDLTQETFVTALRKGVVNFDPPAAWVFLRSTARFVFLHHVRAQRSTPIHPDTPALADAVDELWDCDAGFDGGVQLLRDLKECVEQLQGRAQQAIRLSYGIGVEPAPTREAAAQQMGMLPNGLKTLLQRTRQLLRACIERNQA